MDRKDYIAGILKGLRYRAIPGSVSCQAADLIEQQAAEIERLLKSDGWVSVEERLPQAPALVLIADAVRGNVSTDQYLDDEIGFLREWYTHCEKGYGQHKFVTHWRPLPTPPGGDHD